MPSRRVLWSVLKTLASTGLCANELIISHPAPTPCDRFFFVLISHSPTHSLYHPPAHPLANVSIHPTHPPARSSTCVPYPPVTSSAPTPSLNAANSPPHFRTRHSATPASPQLPAIAAPVSSGSIARYGKLSALLRYFTG